ncbi:MAG TPA: polyprenyl synthetase family protein [Kofleriaceae bacterium]|jgi:octaprenyl-diphosphate synthase
MSVAYPHPTTVLDRLAGISATRDARDLAARLAELDRWVRADLVDFEAELVQLPRGARVVQKAAHHLLDLRGKHLRPTCVVLASRFGDGFTPAARSLAVAVELVHTATLLHDDVVDLAEHRRGQPAACTVYGNAASIFAGDWLLVAALRRIAASGFPGVLDKMLAVIDEMILAESLQLERRGRIEADPDEYFRIVEGKTASLFRWAMAAGASASGRGPELELALDRYGLHLGVAFQAIDDELDFRTSGTGKDAFADLREGKMTYPLVVALERQPALRARIQAVLDGDLGEIDAIAIAIRETGALAATRKLAEDHAGRALEALAGLPAGPARDALETVVLASLERVS